MLMGKIKLLFKNKVVMYLATRYLTYFFQFLSSIIIAVKLGPYYFGVWGFLLLLINYFRISNFGVSNAVNILIVQNKENKEKVKNLVLGALACTGILSLMIILFALYYYLFGIPFFQKYEVGVLFYVVCFIAVLTHFNTLLMNIYRIKNRLFEVAVQQSSVPILVLLTCFVFRDKELVYALLGAHVIGNVLTLLIFIFKKQIPWKGSFSVSILKAIINKGFYLFLYTICFYLIIVSIKTIISVYYSVEDFGYFTFSYSLANVVLLFLQALTFIVFPKIIDKLKSKDTKSVALLIKNIRVSYVSLAFGLGFLSLIIFPLFLEIVPKYKEALTVMQLSVLTVVLYTNSFGYGTYLMAQNKEKTIAKISSFALLINVSLALGLIHIFHVTYEYVILATTITYILYTYLCVHFGKRQMGLKDGLLKNFTDCFQLSLLVPYIIAIAVVLSGIKLLLPLPLIIYIFLNKKAIKEIILKVKTIINKPNVIDL